MNIKHKIFGVALGALAMGMVSVHATASAPEITNSPAAAMAALFGDPVIVTGTGFEIKRSSLDQIMVGAKAQAATTGQALPPTFEASALNQLIAIQLLLQKATPADIATGDQEADLQYTNILKRYGSPEAFARQLKAVGITMEELRAKARQEAVAKAALKRELNVPVSDTEVKDFYLEHPSDFEMPEKVHVRHLLLMTIDPSTPAQTPLAPDVVAAKQKQIEELLKRARAGEDFATLVRQYTEDTSTKDSGGEYTFARGQMLPEFEAAAFSMTNGQISDVVTTKYGFHIIKLLDRIPAKKVEFPTVSDDIKNFLAQQKISKIAPAYMEKLKLAADVKVLDANLKAEVDAAEAATAAAASQQPPAGISP